MSQARWEAAFVAMTVALGGDVDGANAMLGEDGARRARRVTAALAASSRPARARVLAAALAEILIDVRALEPAP